MPFRSLTLAFLLIGLMGAILVAVLVGQRTRSEFNRFRFERDQATLRAALSTYYATYGRWDGIGAQLTESQPLLFYSLSMALVDSKGVVVFGNRGYAIGQRVQTDVLSGSTLLYHNGQTIGYVLFVAPSGGQAGAGRLPPPDEIFLQRVTDAALISAVVAALIALLLGTMLARTLTRPLRELTAATHAMARGDLDQRVTVHSDDEIGELATSFNLMSADLARASQLRKQMTADLAHDLRTPLSILRGYTQGCRMGDSRARPNSTPSCIVKSHICNAWSKISVCSHSLMRACCRFGDGP